MRVSIVATAICLSIVGLSMAADAEAAVRRPTSIPAQGLGPALQTLAKDRDFQVLYRTEIVGDLRTGGAVGEFTVDEALTQLLSGTGLRHQFLDDTTVMVIPAAATVPVSKPAAGVSESGLMYLAQVERASTPVPDATSPRTETARIEEVIVTGSKIARTDYKTVQPLTVIGGDEIKNGAVGTPLELMSRLPVLGALSAYENQDGGRTRGSASSINMRGLGGQNTLILFNGRRVPYYSLPLGSLVFYNINNLPMAAVGRVEVLRDGASAVYGADATAGVVNFITDRDVDDGRVAVRYADTFDGAAPEYRATLSHGLQFNDGHSKLLFTVDAYSRDPLMAVDRDFTMIGDKRGRVPEPFGSSAAWNHLTNLAPYAAFTVQPVAGLPNQLPGLGTSAAHVDFNGNIAAGNRNPANYYNDAHFFSVMPGRDSRDVFLTFSHSISPQLELFSELGYNHVKSVVYQSPMTIASTQNRDADDQVMVIPADNYHNPFGSRFYGPGTANPGIAPRAVQFNYLEEGIGPRIGKITTSQDRILLGLRGTVLDEWQWELAALRSTNTARDTTRNMISRSALTASLARDTPDAFNMFAGPGANAEAVLDEIRTTSYIGGDSSLSLVDAKLSGPLWKLPNGNLNFAAGAEYRDEELSSDHSANYLVDDLINVAAQDSFNASRSIGSLFLEFQVPLSKSDGRLWFSGTELQIAARMEHFNDFGTTTKPRIGIATTLLPSLFLRASVGEGFRAPTLTQLYGSEGRSMAARVDPFRPQDGNVRRLMRQPAVPTLQAENTKSQIVGLVFEPKFIPGLSFGVDWWSYQITDQIAVIGRDAQLAIEAANGPYSNPNVVRIAATPEEPIGPIVAIIEPWRNFARVETDGYDFSVTYAMGVAASGKFTLGIDATYIDEYWQQLDPAEPAESFPTDQSRPRFRGTSWAEFERNDWRVRTTYNYVSDYAPFDPVVVGDLIYRIPSFGTWDTLLTWRYKPRDISVTVGVNNVLDDEPPLYPIRQGYDARMASPQGRFGYLNATLRF